MKPRKLMLTIEILTNISAKEFTKFSMEALFINNFAKVIGYETLKVHQVRVQVVKENK